MTPERKIINLERNLEASKKEVKRLKAEHTAQYHFIRTYPENTWYIAFLQSEVSRVEQVNEKLLEDFAKLLDFSKQQTKLLASFDVVTPTQPF